MRHFSGPAALPCRSRNSLTSRFYVPTEIGTVRSGTTGVRRKATRGFASGWTLAGPLSHHGLAPGSGSHATKSNSMGGTTSIGWMLETCQRLGCTSCEVSCAYRTIAEMRACRHICSEEHLIHSPCSRSEEHTSELQSLRHLVCRL